MKKQGSKKLILHPPYRPQYLLSTQGFIKYCRDNGISISKKELEKLHKEKLLYPAIKVYRGVVEYKKIYANFNGKQEWRFVDPKDIKSFKPTKIAKEKYYCHGSFSMGFKEWLDWYKKRKMVEFPAFMKFLPWDKKNYLTFTDQTKEIEKYYEFFYEKLQLFALRIVINGIKVWKCMADSDKEKNEKWLRGKIAELYKFLKFYIEIEDSYNNWRKIKEDKLKEYKQKGYNKKEIKREWEEEFDCNYQKVLKLEAEIILEKHKITLENIKKWQYFIAQQSLFGEAHRASSCIRTYLKAIDEKFLIEAEDANYMIYIINFIIYCLKGEDLTVKQVIGNIDDKYCKVCGNYFKPKKKEQITCGNPYCIKENKNRSKKLKRNTIKT